MDATSQLPLESHIGKWTTSGIVVALGGLVSVGPNDTLLWEFDPSRCKWKKPAEDLFAQFACLWEEKTSTIISFANKWGPLRIDAAGKEIGVAHNSGAEPLEWWRYLSRRAHSVLRIAEELDKGRIGSDDDWDFITSVHRGKQEGEDRFGLPEQTRWEYSEHVRKWSGYPDALSYERAAIAGEVSNWLRQFSVGVCVAWNDSTASWQVEMAYHGRMLSAVALQMAFKITHGERMFTCSGCNKWYERKSRRPNLGQANFCDTCLGKRTPQREAEKRYRQNRRDARQLAAQGTSIVDIANKLNRTTNMVRNWVRAKGKRNG